MSMFEYLKIPDIILSLFLHKNWTGLILLAPTVCSWAFSQRQSVIILEDLNLDRLKPNCREGKLLRDIEDIFEFTCLIEEPTRPHELHPLRVRCLMLFSPIRLICLINRG